MSRRSRAIPKEWRDRVESTSGDIRDFADVTKIIFDFKIDKIIHVAYTLTAEGEANPLAAIQVNVLGTCNIFEAARIRGTQRVVFCSSTAAFGSQDHFGDLPLRDEEDFMKPFSIYGATKLLDEFMATRFERRYGIEIPVLRIAAVYGLGVAERGAMAWTSQMIAAVTRNQPVFIPLRPDQPVCFIHIDDVAEQLVRLCLAEKLGFRFYNSGGYTSTPGNFRDIVQKYYPAAEITFDEKAPLWSYPYRIDGRRLANEIHLAIRDPESGLLDQMNQERSVLGLEPLQRK
jgi:nucleoside-diphosphate-sugar epimerase